MAKHFFLLTIQNTQLVFVTESIVANDLTLIIYKWSL